MALEKIMKNSSGVPTGEYERIAGGTLYADLPVKSWIKWDDQTNIPTGFLKAGDTISQSEYPELYAEYGATVPYKADTSELSAYENISLSTDSSSPTIMQYDGFISVYVTRGLKTSTGTGVNIYVNGVNNVWNVDVTTNYTAHVGGTVPVKKGDSVYIAVASDSTDTQQARFYKKSLIVKAKQIALPADLASGVEEYIDEKFEVEDLSSQISSTVASGMLCYKCGKTVTLVFSNVLVSSNGQITGVPKNANIATGALIASDASASAYLSTGAIGNNYINVNIGASNKHYYGSITYFTND